MILTEFTGIDTIVYYTPKIFKIAGYISNEQSILPAIIVGSSNVIFTIVSIFLVDRIGRRLLYFIGLSGLVITLFSLGFCFHFQNELRRLFQYTHNIYNVSFYCIICIKFRTFVMAHNFRDISI